MPTPARLSRDEYPCLYVNLWGPTRYNTAFATRADYTDELFASVDAINDRVGVNGRFMFVMHLPAGNHASSGTPTDPRGLDNTHMPPPQWSAMPTFRQNGINDVAHLLASIGCPWSVYGRQGKHQTANQYAVLDPYDVWQAKSVTEFALRPSEEVALTFLAATMWPFMQRGCIGFLTDGTGSDVSVLSAGGNIALCDAGREMQEYLRELGITHVLEAFKRSPGAISTPFDPDYIDLNQAALDDYYATRSGVRAPLRSGQIKHVWLTQFTRNRVGNGSIEDAPLDPEVPVPGSLKALLDDADKFGFIIDTYESGSTGAEETEDYAIGLWQRPHLERCWAHTGGNTIKLLVYPPSTDWGTFTFATGSITVTVNGVARTVTNEGTAVARTTGRLDQTITINGAAIQADDEVVVTCATGAWTSQTGVQSRAAVRICENRAANTFSSMQVHTFVGESPGAYTQRLNEDVLALGALSGSPTSRIIFVRVRNQAGAAGPVNVIAARIGGDQNGTAKFTIGGTTSGTLNANSNLVIQVTVTSDGTSLRGNYLVIETDHHETPFFVLRFSDTLPGQLRAYSVMPASYLADNPSPWIMADLDDDDDPVSLALATPDVPGTHPVVLENEGTSDLAFTEDAVSSDGTVTFTPSLNGVTLKHGERLDCLVTFTPASYGDVADGKTVTINHDGSNSGFVINLTSVEPDESPAVNSGAVGTRGRFGYDNALGSTHGYQD